MREDTEWDDAYAEGHEEGYETGRKAGKLEKLETFLSVSLDTEISVLLSDNGKEVYRKGFWRTLRSLYPGTRFHLLPQDSLNLTMSIGWFVKLFGRYARQHGEDALAELFQGRCIKLHDVTLNFEVRKLTDVIQLRLGKPKEDAE